MKYKPRLATLGVLVMLTVPARSADPPFPDTINLLGSAVYNETDWTVNVDESGSIAMDTTVNGLLYQPANNTSGNSVRHQHIRQYTVEDGVAWATFRLAVTDSNDTEDIGFVFGVYKTDDDPFNGTPTQGAYVTKATEDDQVVLKVCDSSGCNTPVNAMEINPTTEYDFVIKVESGKVTFWYRTAGGSWNDPPVVFDDSVPADHVPEDTANLRFSGAVKTIDDENVDYVTIRLFEFEASAGD
jgi:hypothetical protein